MLVLSRKPDQEFRFPQLGITVRVISVKGQQIRVGIDAPKEVDVLRGELDDDVTRRPILKVIDQHVLANCLHSAKLALHVAERQYAMGKRTEAEMSLRDTLAALTLLEVSARDPNPGNAPPAAGKRVLLVEDDANECRLLAGLLELEGYRVTTAANGNEAMSRLGVEAPDFVLLDMLMPEMNGAETIACIRANRQLAGLKVFSVSGTSPGNLGVPVGPDGVDAWFPKPLDPAEMLSKLRSLTNSAA